MKTTVSPAIAQFLVTLGFDSEFRGMSTADIIELANTQIQHDTLVRHVAIINHVTMQDVRFALQDADAEFSERLATIIEALKKAPYQGCAKNALPSKARLACLGLIAPNHDVAYGFCYVRPSKSLSLADEIVLRYPSRIQAFADIGISLEDAVGHLVHLTDVLRTQESYDPIKLQTTKLQVAAAYIVAAVSKFRYFSIWDGALHKLSADDLITACDSKELKNLCIAGVNAPDAFLALPPDAT